MLSIFHLYLMLLWLLTMHRPIVIYLVNRFQYSWLPQLPSYTFYCSYYPDDRFELSQIRQRTIKTNWIREKRRFLRNIFNVANTRSMYRLLFISLRGFVSSKCDDEKYIFSERSTHLDNFANELRELHPRFKHIYWHMNWIANVNFSFIRLGFLSS
jgi:hypothetical protein